MIGKQHHQKNNSTLVCDIGSYSIKLGFAGNLIPDIVVPCRVGCAITKNYNNKEQFVPVGKDLPKDKHLKIGYKYPLQTGRVNDWNSFEMVLKHGLKSLFRHGNGDGDDEDYSQHKILLTKPYGMKKGDLQQLVETFFVKFGFRAVTMHEQAAMVLYTQGVETGVVVELGESATSIVPVYKGHAIPKLDRSLAVGGQSIVSYLVKLLRLKGFPLHETEDLEIGRQLKEAVCYAPLELETEERLAVETSVLAAGFKLPDGTFVSLERERFGSVEALFQPALYNVESRGLSDLIFDVIQDANIDCRADLYRNVILSGGTSLTPGIQERLTQDLNRRYTKDVIDGDPSRSLGWTPQVHAPSSRQFLVFEGAALFADYISDDPNYWVSREDFSLVGIQGIIDKCTF